MFEWFYWSIQTLFHMLKITNYKKIQRTRNSKYSHFTHQNYLRKYCLLMLLRYWHSCVYVVGQFLQFFNLRSQPGFVTFLDKDLHKHFPTSVRCDDPGIFNSAREHPSEDNKHPWEFIESLSIPVLTFTRNLKGSFKFRQGFKIMYMSD